jgi:hypothetical protein
MFSQETKLNNTHWINDEETFSSKNEHLAIIFVYAHVLPDIVVKHELWE